MAVVEQNIKTVTTSLILNSYLLNRVLEYYVLTRYQDIRRTKILSRAAYLVEPVEFENDVLTTVQSPIVAFDYNRDNMKFTLGSGDVINSTIEQPFKLVELSETESSGSGDSGVGVELLKAEQ
jgi:hypothetical protein